MMATRQLSRRMSHLPYRIRRPARLLQERKSLSANEVSRPGTLGDGEALEADAASPNYVRLALTSRVYDMVKETPLQHMSGLSARLGASVHIKLPKLQKNQDKFNAIADKYFVQIRGAHGEHTETDDGIFDISNLRRLGRNEVQLTQDMYNGVKALIQAEKAL